MPLQRLQVGPSSCDHRAVLGLPEDIRACLFDLDGVLTDTAEVHRAAWKATFDPVLAAHDQTPFTADDYTRHVDGKPRLDGVRDFLAARGIQPPEGGPGGAPGAETIFSIGERKNADVQRRIHDNGVTVFDGSRRYLQAAAAAGLRRVVVSSSANAADILAVTGLAEWVEDRVDGVTIAERGIRGKPAPDSFLAGAAAVGVPAAQAAVFEDATSGVAAGRDGAFGYVVGVNRVDDKHAEALKDNGAVIVVMDLEELL